MAYLLAWLMLAVAPDDAATHAVKVQLDHPDLQLAAFLKLFEGERVGDPASALAAWRRANGNSRTPGKAIEAAIAAMNPDMIREAGLLDNGQFFLDFGPEKGEPRWFLRVPFDDGTLAAFATALALSGGASEPALDGIQIDRLGPAGSPLMARKLDDGRHMPRLEPIVVAGRRDEIAGAFAGMPRPLSGSERTGSNHGLSIYLDPKLLAKSESIAVRQAAELFLGLGIVGNSPEQGNYAYLKFHPQTDRMAPYLGVVALNRRQGPSFPAKLDPAWLDSIPGSASVAFAFAVDPQPAMWDALFAALDRAEKADPGKAKAAPIRARLNLLATIAGVKPEVDLWPKLRGVSGFVSMSPNAPAKAESAMISLHLTDEDAAKQLATDFVPKVARFLKLGPAEEGEIRTLGRVSGRPVVMTRRGSSVWLGWGEKSMVSALEAADDPSKSARGTILHPRNFPKNNSADRLVAVWPGRLGRDVSGLEDAPPVVWSGVTFPGGFQDYVIWPDLKTTLHAYLENLPMEPRK